jgi:hypothetical protein
MPNRDDPRSAAHHFVLRCARDTVEEGKMRISSVALAAAALLFGLPAARAQSLIVTEVEAPGINCVFAPSCTITVNDSVGFIPLPYLAAPNAAFLQSRTVPGAPGTPAAGKAGYLYRISLTQAAGSADCLGGLVLNFGPALRLPFRPGQLADVFVITGGGLGSIGLKSATRFGDVIVFDLAKGLCLAGGPDMHNTSFFFGLAAETPTMTTPAQIFSSGNPPLYSVQARVPAH